MAKVFVETYGCAFNVADGEALEGVLARAGHQLAARAEDAEAIVLNTCTVKDRSYLDFKRRFGALAAAAARGEGPAVVLAGCIPRAHEREPWLEGVTAIGPATLESAPAAVEAALAGRPERNFRPSASAAPRLALPSRRKNPLVEIVPIAAGCLSACTFCQTRLARGRLESFPPGAILRRIARAAAEGVREVWLTGQDLGAWGRDLGYPLPRLLKEACAIEGDFKLRLGMTSPQWVAEQPAAWIGALADEKMFRFLHVPVQSGSDRILAAMRRGHTVADFASVAESFAAAHPEGTLMTDIIVGYPTETEEDFAATLALLERVRPAAVNRSRFSPRPGTAAARLEPLAPAVMRERSRRLEEVARQVAREWHARLVGRRLRVLTAEHQGGLTIAHTASWRPVGLPGPLALGDWIDVEIVGAADYHLKGRPIPTNVLCNKSEVSGCECAREA